jgi:hypothetical protein
MFLNQLQQVNSAEAVAPQNPVADAVRRRLDGVAHWLGDRDYLEGSAALELVLLPPPCAIDSDQCIAIRRA